MTTTATQSHCTQVINASDFSNSITDVLRDRWTVGKMYHLIKALAGQPVAITLDKQTGFTEFNVTLASTFHGAWGARVRVVYTHTLNPERGTGQNVTDYRLDDTANAIIVLPQADGKPTKVKWDALDSYRKHCSAAIAEAKKLADGTGREWGTWKATVIDGNRVDVTYTPSTGNPAFADKWGERGYWRINVQG